MSPPWSTQRDWVSICDVISLGKENKNPEGSSNPRSVEVWKRGSLFLSLFLIARFYQAGELYWYWGVNFQDIIAHELKDLSLAGLGIEKVYGFLWKWKSIQTLNWGLTIKPEIHPKLYFSIIIAVVVSVYKKILLITVLKNTYFIAFS